jgi:hypothetical protein
VSEASREPAVQALLAAIDAVEEDVGLVQLWACALSGFAQPVPDYGPDPLRSRSAGGEQGRGNGSNRGVSQPRSGVLACP